MRTVHKYEIPARLVDESDKGIVSACQFDPEFTLNLPKGAQSLELGIQRERSNSFFLWALVDPDAELEPRKFIFFGTGHFTNRNTNLHYVSTWVSAELVFHLFEVVE